MNESLDDLILRRLGQLPKGGSPEERRALEEARATRAARSDTDREERARVDALNEVLRRFVYSMFLAGDPDTEEVCHNDYFQALGRPVGEVFSADVTVRGWRILEDNEHLVFIACARSLPWFAGGDTGDYMPRLFIGDRTGVAVDYAPMFEPVGTRRKGVRVRAHRLGSSMTMRELEGQIPDGIARLLALHGVEWRTSVSWREDLRQCVSRFAAEAVDHGYEPDTVVILNELDLARGLSRGTKRARRREHRALRQHLGADAVPAWVIAEEGRQSLVLTPNGVVWYSARTGGEEDVHVTSGKKEVSTGPLWAQIPRTIRMIRQGRKEA